MNRTQSRILAIALIVLCAVSAMASAYNDKPKLVVVIVVDQLRGDMIERYHDEFAPGGFRLFMDKGAWFSSCYYNYANTRTAPGHATLGTGTYTLGHGIMANEWWNPTIRKFVTSVEDPKETLIGAPTHEGGSSPRNLLTDTFGDELKLATGGKAKVYGIALKDRAAILPVGYSANAAFFIDHTSGAWLTSTYYMKEAPEWLVALNKAGLTAKYLNREWKDANGKVLRSTAPAKDDKGRDIGFYDLVGSTPFANDYTIDLAKAVIENEKLGTGPVTDLISISFSSHDILGHKFGPDSEQEHAMMLALDRQFADFFRYLDEKIGAGNYVLALAADHGISPTPEYAANLRLPAFAGNSSDYVSQLNHSLSVRLGHEAKYVVRFDYPNAYLDEQAVIAAKASIADAEDLVGQEMMRIGMRGYITKSDLAKGRLPNTVFAEKFRNAYSPLPGSYVLGISAPFLIGYSSGTDHALPYSYDSHVPLAFYGPQFLPGVYRETVEPVDLAVTITSILGVNKPASSMGRPLVEAIADQQERKAELVGAKK